MVAGDAVNVAARLEQAAAPGTVLVGERTWRPPHGSFEFGPPQARAQGKSEPVKAFHLLGHAAEHAGASPDSGRR